ncbi:MAG: 2OG-Fe(II) oxygenase [Oceanospirillaceae bacterium]|nr:2OG-Fe(II) oxygenase [Oceanospirillaceae bacterium]
MSSAEQISPLDPVDLIYQHGLAIVPGFIAADICTALRADIRQLLEAGEFRQAGVGRGAAQQTNQDIRRDRIHWLDGSTPAQQAYLACMEEYRIALNSRCFLGLLDYEAHFAHYNPGEFYRKHLDAFQGRSNRRVTTVVYLNDGWQSEWGGELEIFTAQDESLLKVEPQAGTLVSFLSDEFPHQVLPATQPRLSIAGWFRINQSLAGVIDPAR